MVGRNNAGKSTIIEALRYISIIVNRIGALSFENVPNWLEIPGRNRGVKPSLRGIDFNDKTLFHRYGDPPAVLRATLSGGLTVTVYFGGEDRIFGVIEDGRGRPVTTKGAAKRLMIPRIHILPQIGPLQRMERILKPDYFRTILSAPYQSIHFRNHIAYSRHRFAEFQRMSSESWPGISVSEIDAPPIEADGNISLLIREGGFTAEIGWMGHGLQMWLQMIWFLVSADAYDTVILDEPDVYMHADLQRRLIRMLRNRHRQTVVATHSVEMLSEVPAENVLIIDRQSRSSKFALSNPAVQRIVDHIGAVHNIQLARLWAAKKFLLLEGLDLEFLEQFHQILQPRASESLKSIPNVSIGGWSGWHYVIGSQLLLTNATGKEIKIHCLFDRDYHTQGEIDERKAEALDRGIILHIWNRKEIENYILVPTAIHRTINSSSRKIKSVSLDDVSRQLDIIAEKLKDDLFDALANACFLQNKGKGSQAGNREAREIVEKSWSTQEGRLTLVPGKAAFSMLAEWAQLELGVSINKGAVIRAMNPSEVPVEMVSFLQSLTATDA